MTYPTGALLSRVRDGALGLLRLGNADADADRIGELAAVVLELIRDRLGQTTPYAAVYADGMPYDEATIPAPVLEAAVVSTAEMYRRKDAPFGITGAWGDDGINLRISRDPLAGVEHLLAPYRVAWGIA